MDKIKLRPRREVGAGIKTSTGVLGNCGRTILPETLFAVINDGQHAG